MEVVMKCPACTTTELAMSERQGVEIDYCPQCRGVWLDRGELDKLIERGNAVSAPARPANNPAVGFGNQGRYDDSDRRDERSRHEHQAYPARKKKSFLGEMFDFD